MVIFVAVFLSFFATKRQRRYNKLDRLGVASHLSTTQRWGNPSASFATTQVNLPACSPHRPFNSERQTGKLCIPIFKSSFDPTKHRNLSLPFQKLTFHLLRHLGGFPILRQTLAKYSPNAFKYKYKILFGNTSKYKYFINVLKYILKYFENRPTSAKNKKHSNQSEFWKSPNTTRYSFSSIGY